MEIARAMTILYKYCDQLGAVKIIASLELKLPYISQVNDPLECSPDFHCPNDKSAIKSRVLSASINKNINPFAGGEQELDERIEKGEIQRCLVGCERKHHEKWNKKQCLLSVSKKAQESVIWAHYTETHKGAVIGFDFEKIFPARNIKLSPVNYSTQRPKVNVLKKSEEDARKVLTTKSKSWKYEKEFRGIFTIDLLEDFQSQGLACIKDFNGKETWFLRLNPESIRKVIFGLNTDDSLKVAIKKLIERPELQHVKLYHVEESETYTFKLVKENK